LGYDHILQMGVGVILTGDLITTLNREGIFIYLFISRSM